MIYFSHRHATPRPPRFSGRQAQPKAPTIHLMTYHSLPSNKTTRKKDYRFLVMILVMACLIVMPAFSTSFFDRPVVRQIFSAGGGT